MAPLGRCWGAAAPLACLVLVAALAGLAEGAGPAYFVAAEEVDWDYAPSGMNLCKDAEHALEGSSRFRKAAYVEYTDATFKVKKPRAAGLAHTGLLGPVFRASVNDSLSVTLLNRLSFPVNIEPAGLQGAGGSEGAAADFAPPAEPGGTVSYAWAVPAAAALPAGEAGAKFWLYRSSVDIDGHANAGLLGGVLVHAQPPGAGAEPGSAAAPLDVITVFQVINETKSPLHSSDSSSSSEGMAGMSHTPAGEAMAMGGHMSAHAGLWHAINGYVYCNLPPPEAEQGQSVRWHVASVGSNMEIHNAHWHGNTFLNHGRRADQLKLIPGTAHSVLVDAAAPGTWMFHCHVNDHMRTGMVAMYKVNPTSARNATTSARGETRRYYVAAEEVEWDYAPAGANMCDGTATGTPFNDMQFTFIANSSTRVGTKFTKAVYRQYTDDSFSTPMQRSEEDEALGMLGPVLRGAVGDTLEVVFANKLRSYATSMHPHGVMYLKDSEGSPYRDGTAAADKADDAVPPGAKHTYVWEVTEAAAPGPSDPSTLVWMYHSHTDETADTLAGLVGAIVVGRREDLKEDLTAKGVDREVVLFFSVMDELGSLFAPDNLRKYLGVEGAAEGLEAQDPDFAEHYLKHSINGYLYCGSPHPLAFTRGDRVRFHIMALGTEVDMHAANVRKETMDLDGLAVPVVDVVPGSMRTSDVVMANAGSGHIQCRIGDHIDAGMSAVFSVAEAGVEAAAGAADGAQQRTYYIAAQQVTWDYAPRGADLCDGSAEGSAFTDAQLTYVGHSAHSVGTKYEKAVYRQYTDDSFETEVEAPASHGLLGPLLTANVGDRLRIVFKNRMSVMAVNIALDGGLIALSGPGTAGSVEGGKEAGPELPGVKPGETATYEYLIPPSAGPASDDLSTVAYAYTSSVSYDNHPSAGLVGALVVGAAGAFPPQGGAAPQVPAGVDALVPLLYMVQDENASPLLLKSLEAAGLVDSVGDPPGPPWSADFEETNRKHSVNGYLYCNMPPLSAAAGSVVRFVLLSLGSEGDLHGPVFEGQLARTKAGGVATAELMPAVTRVVDVTASGRGTWKVYCATQSHLQAGMVALLRVE